MTSLVASSRAACCSALVLLAAGCGCVSLQDATTRNQALEEDNRSRSEPAMQRAATALGAVMLPAVVGSGATPRPCAESKPDAEGHYPPILAYDQTAPSADVRCVEPVDATGRILRFIEHRTQARLLVPVDAPHSEYARLAWRGRTLYVLLPEVTREKVDQEEQCECDSWPRVEVSMLTGFWIPERDYYEVREVKVPITVEYVDWHCPASARSAQARR
jgi:hypothetical protein